MLGGGGGAMNPNNAMVEIKHGFYFHILFLKSYFGLSKILLGIIFILYFFKLSGKSCIVSTRKCFQFTIYPHSIDLTMLLFFKRFCITFLCLYGTGILLYFSLVPCSFVLIVQIFLFWNM